MTGYFGSKYASGLYQNIIALMPPHDTYIETHLGGGAVMRKKPPARNNIAIDIDPEPLESFDCGNQGKSSLTPDEIHFISLVSCPCCGNDLGDRKGKADSGRMVEDIPPPAEKTSVFR